MLTKSEIAREVEEVTGIKPNLTKSVLDALAEIAMGEIQAGEDFSLPGIARVSFRYSKALKKGERHRKGETYVGFGGVETTAEADSPPRKAKVKLTATPAASLKRSVLPDSKPETQAAFLKSKAGRNVAQKKGR